MQEVSSLKQNKGAGGKAGQIISKLKDKPFLMSLLFNVAALLVCLIFFRPTYEVSDDYMTDAVLSGAFGSGYEPYLLWGNALLGYALVFLYKLIPSISFYFILLVVLGFLSSTAIIYLLFKKKTNIVTICMAVTFLAFFTDDLYILVQFTKVAAVAGIAGGLLVIHGIWEAEKRKALYVILGTLLTLTGSMVRFSLVYLYGAYLLVAFIFYSVTYVKTKKKAGGAEKTSGTIAAIGKRFLVCVMLVGLLFGIEYIGSGIRRNDPRFREFNDFQNYRPGVTDSMKPDYEVVQAEFEKMGLDFNDYCMMAYWHIVDKNVYSNETLAKVGSLLKEYNDSLSHSPAYIVKTIFERGIPFYPAALVMYLFLTLAGMFGKHRIYPAVILLTTIFFFVFFIYTGRTVYRVELGVFYCAVACIMASLSFNDDSSFVKQKTSFFGKNMATVVSALILIFVAGFRIAMIIPSPKYRSMSDEEYMEEFDNTMRRSGEYMPWKTRFLANFRKPEPDLVSYIENDKDNYYYVDFTSGIQTLYYNYDPWIRPEQGLFLKYGYFGSVVIHHPGEKSALASVGADPDNPYRSLLNDNIYVVDRFYPEVKLIYLRKYYNPNARAKVVKEINGLKIIKYYVPKEQIQ